MRFLIGIILIGISSILLGYQHYKEQKYLNSETYKTLDENSETYKTLDEIWSEPSQKESDCGVKTVDYLVRTNRGVPSNWNELSSDPYYISCMNK